MKPNLLSFASLAFLVFAGWQVAATVSRTPAFNRSLQVEAENGSRVLGYTQTMYDRAEYLGWIARGWNARTYDTALPGKEGSDERKQALRNRAGRTRVIATESLRHNPGDPATWLLVANADSKLGDGERALVAWRNSYELAPHDAVVSLNRLYFLIGFMSRPGGRDLALATITPTMVQAELQTIANGPGMRTLPDSLSAHPSLAAFVREQAEED